VACVFAARLAAYDFTTLKPQGYVSDFAGVIDAGTKQQLETYCARVKDATGAEMALVTLPTLHGEPVEDVANLLYRTWGVGAKGKDEGVMLLLVVNDRRSRLEVGYGLEPIIPDGFAGSLLREMRPALRGNHYGDAFAIAARTLGGRIAAAKNVTVADAPQPRRRPRDEGIPWPIVVPIALFVLFLLSNRGRGGRGGGFGGFPIFFPPMGGGGWGGSSHGGFGGYDSGGGFGGFGGGDSGGGGASSDW
jgi:uncharacterized protein